MEQLFLPIINHSNKGWGPSNSPAAAVQTCLARVGSFPFEPSLKQEKLGRICDFTYATSQRQQRDREARGAAHPGPEEDTDFQLVDSRPLRQATRPNRFAQRQRQQQQQQQRQQQINQMQQKFQARLPGKGTQARQAMQEHYQQQRQLNWRLNQRQRALAEWSIEPQQDWTVQDEFTLSTLGKMHLDPKQVIMKDLEFRGELKPYDRSLDQRVTPKRPICLSEPSPMRTFYWTGTQSDELIIDQVETNEAVKVAATDTVLACLMSAPQSRQSWHLTFLKIDGKIIIDKADGSAVDLPTVDETSREPPLPDHPIKINRPAKLSQEALHVTYNFSHQALNTKTDESVKFEKPPFVEDSETPAFKAYRYRLITIPPLPMAQKPEEKMPITIVTRGEIDSYLPDQPEDNRYVMVRALNEYELHGKPWRQQLENQKGALLAQEIRNNNCKLNKWVSQATISGCEVLKLGFITRSILTENTRHMILDVDTYKIRDIGQQIGMKPGSAWGSVRAILNAVYKSPDGKYVLLKDPVHPLLKLYQVPDEELGQVGDEGKEQTGADGAK